MIEGKLDVVAVGAHPDDVEIGCGGTLALLTRQGFRVGIVDLTDGEPTPGSPNPETRIAEAEQAARQLGVQREILGFANRALFDSVETRMDLAKVLRRCCPKVVLGLLGKTPMASPDHWQASQITDAAVFYSRLTKWDDRFDGLPPHRIERLAYYSLLHFEFQPRSTNQFVVDISETHDAKMAAIRSYASQFPPEKQYVLDRATAIAQANGSAAGFEYGEVLTLTKALGTQRPMETFLVSDQTTESR